MSLTHLLLRFVLGRRLPITAGELRIRGPKEPITIRRDKFGIPHIDATSEADGMFALGFCQAQDRAGQLEFLKRVAVGRLAEWVGPDGLIADRLSRRIGFRRYAEIQVAALDNRVREQLTAFAAGISNGNISGLSSKPHEFAILGGDPTPWDAADVLAVLKLQSFLLPSNWDVELARLRILLADGPQALLDLDPLSAFGKESGKTYKLPLGDELASTPLPTTSIAPAIAALMSDLAAFQSYLSRGGGSNNWVITGNRTQSGKPILASDPHLAPSVPPPWYLSHIRTPEWEATGASLTGTPGFAIGHNGFAAWGVTAGLTDNTDIFLETMGSDGKSVREMDGTFAPCELIRETIAVKGQSDVIEETLITPRGPLLSPLLKGIPHAVSLRAVWLNPLPVDGFLGSPRAKSFEEFRGYFDRWPLLPLNILYADTDGTTGWFLIGQLPKRAGGNGLIPRPADHPNTGWTGLVTFDEMPFVKNPESGYFTTANNEPFQTDPNNPWLGADYCDHYRVRAILDALASRDGWTVEDCLALQRDVRSIPWEEVRAIVLSLESPNQNTQEALDLLRAWDGQPRVCMNCSWPNSAFESPRLRLQIPGELR
jgi:penicillin amidase